MLKTVLTAPLTLVRAVLDPRVSPLRHLPPVQRFQVMCVLGLMWTSIFTVGTGVWYLYGELVALHVLMAAGTLVTGFTFRKAATRTQPTD